MANTHQIIFYPVGNGDTTQVILSGGRRILLDFCHRNKAESDDTPEMDLSARLKSELKSANRSSFDVVAFTHADADHIQGSTAFFELLHAKKYQGEGRVSIKELWVPAAMLLETADNDHQTEEFVLLRQEARHRLLNGQGILVFSRPQSLIDWLTPELKKRGEAANARDHLFVDAGQIVPGFTLAADGVEFFCHSPFIKHCDDGDILRNDAALVFNVRLRADGNNYDYLHVGDATSEVLEDIVNISKKHNNEGRLKWDLYNIPHHCSYLSLNVNGEKGQRITEPTSAVKELLLLGKKDAYVVSSSKPIPDIAAAYNQVQPPHIQARKCYEKYLATIKGRKLFVTMEEPNTNRPQPLVFEITKGGVTLSRTASIGVSAIITSSPPRAG